MSEAQGSTDGTDRRGPPVAIAVFDFDLTLNLVMKEWYRVNVPQPEAEPVGPAESLAAVSAEVDTTPPDAKLVEE